MNVSNNRLPGGVSKSTMWLSLTVMIVVLALTACGGGTSSEFAAETPLAESCNPADPATAGECGTLLVGLTDADGDFLSYSVDVLSLELEKADGTIVETLPQSTRIDFAQYVDLTEFVSVATVPPGTYVAGTIRLDYSNAEVFVEAGDAAKDATVVDSQGNPLGQTALTIRLADRNQLFINRATTSLLTVDFDLDASHTVDIAPTPAIATAEPFVVAELDPVDSKEIRVRGLFVEANEAEMYYVVAVRPFYDRVGDFGRLRVYVADDTDCEVNEAEFSGVECLRALEAAGQGTLTVAQGTLNVGDRQFTANMILAGSSVPGNGLDAAKGSVISRMDNELTVRGGTVILSDAAGSFFRDDVTVTIGPDTKVYKTFRFDRPDVAIADRLLDISAISVGQNVTVRGQVTANDELGVHIDATEGAVILHVTRLTGIVNAIMQGQVDIDLHSLGGRRPGIFDFFCTGGCEPSTDADPDNYEVATGNLTLDAAGVGRPVAAWGFVNEWMSAPHDFDGHTVIDYSDVRSALGIGWTGAGTTAPFLMMDETGLLLDNMNEQIGERHFIKQGPLLIDLTALNSNTLIAPRESGRMVFVVKTSDSLQLYADWNDFVNALTLSLNGVNTAKSMFARGHYNADTNVFIAYKVFVYILEP
ncbi:MAG: hypothetical protein R3192_15970 [Woeseiaceae bacterium]|nr:hypothetical protein [Woeseiaceae bacterium]